MSLIGRDLLWFANLFLIGGVVSVSFGVRKSVRFLKQQTKGQGNWFYINGISLLALSYLANGLGSAFMSMLH
ncbi:hypothetical protein [Desulfosporosinus sp. FKA]|uniref:hypothetical protein n=1 Tax=Desulfosporosinus sp. FKA TaxID=1969834 RepID=UPI000B49C928|nr:hypothetical protein [Desulfosporosinus sp. FKA]